METYLGMDDEMKVALAESQFISSAWASMYQGELKPCFDVKAVLNMLVIFDKEDVI